MTQRSTVAIVDEQTIFREMLTELLKLDGCYAVIGQFATGREALDGLEEKRPDVVIVDLILPDMAGLECVRKLAQIHPTTRALIVTAVRKPGAVLEAFQSRVRGIVNKRAALRELREAAARVVRGGTFYCSTTSTVLREHGLQSASNVLTERESQIVRLVALGRSSKEIAKELDLSPKTVANHRNRIAAKLQIRDIATLTRYAISRGWVTDDGF